MDGLDDFARSFADALFAAIPELRGHARAEEGRLLIEIRPDPAREDCGFGVTTENEEITVWFGMFHDHFEWPDCDDGVFGNPITFILSVMSDETLVEDWTLDGTWVRSGTLSATEEPDLEDMKPGHVVHIRSWSGSRDRTIRGR